ncbi:hypothetical protein IFM47457_11256 [Aspergillus lentulus]|nr:hypothetical protein IFM47457_11256 [Aspergillus lentulus]
MEALKPGTESPKPLYPSARCSRRFGNGQAESFLLEVRALIAQCCVVAQRATNSAISNDAIYVVAGVSLVVYSVTREGGVAAVKERAGGEVVSV